MNASQSLIEYRIHDQDTFFLITAYYAIRITNNLDRTIKCLSIKEQLGANVTTAKVNVTTSCKNIVPISRTTFYIKSNEQLLCVDDSELLPCESCIIYLTMELHVQKDNRNPPTPVVNCVLVQGVIRCSNLSPNSKNKCEGCNKCKLSSTTCAEPIELPVPGIIGPTGPTGKTGHKGEIGATGPTGPVSPFLTVVDCRNLCSGEDHVAITPGPTTSSNASISIGPKGTGFLSAQKPTPGSITGGECRGKFAVDLQMKRNDPNQVAVGDYSVIGGGLNNLASNAQLGGKSVV